MGKKGVRGVMIDNIHFILGHHTDSLAFIVRDYENQGVAN